MNNEFERIYLTATELHALERDIAIRRHVERYAMVRQWCHGAVLDFACGCGYGTALISKNPDVESIVGIDIDEDSIKYATEQYSHPKIVYKAQSIDQFNGQIDVMVCLETIEHIRDSAFVPAHADRLKIKEIILSYPSKKTTHYNLFHYHDYNTDTLMGLFKSYKLIDEISLHHEVKMLRLQRSEL